MIITPEMRAVLTALTVAEVRGLEIDLTISFSYLGGMPAARCSRNDKPVYGEEEIADLLEAMAAQLRGAGG